MNRWICKGVYPALAGLLFMPLAGCGKPSPPVTYYNLVPTATAAPPSPPTLSDTLAVGVGPVSFPESLERAQIAVRIDEQRLKFSEFHRWSGSLAEDFARVLLEDLSASLPGTARLAIYPWGQYFHPTRRVIIDVRRFDGTPGGEAVLEARWTVSDGEGKILFGSRKSVIRTSAAGDDFLNLVKAQSESVAELAREIALALTGP
ncbi:putative lipoprotein YmbA [Desulfuromonas soudanensis]|uniref:Putative lipoprotein YmbA n=1 Tax=Desulfuromonas soudanensis TaxID=1603606 RepID=A0A0M4DFG7_9BACT|nr:PqiC family protein [Desulfuromonas soudanensis]ALC15245.1 putative lipoprotein YmbA [Desulfuromonas soudanensis]